MINFFFKSKSFIKVLGKFSEVKSYNTLKEAHHEIRNKMNYGTEINLSSDKNVTFN